MEISEIEKYVENFERSVNIEEYLLKYPIDMLLHFDSLNIKQKLQENVLKIYEFEMLVIRSEMKYIELKNLYDEIVAEQFDWYKFDFDKSLRTDEIKEFYIPKDPKVRKIKRLLDKQNIQKNFFKLCVQSLIIQGQRMHDYIKILKIKE